MRSSIFLAVVAALFLAGCAAQPSAGVSNGVYKGELKNIKLRQATSTVITVKDSEAVVEFVNLTEQNKACKATFTKVNSQIAGAASYKGNFDGAIGVCKIFAQYPTMERKLHLRKVGSEVEVFFSWDNLGKETITAGFLK